MFFVILVFFDLTIFSWRFCKKKYCLLTWQTNLNSLHHSWKWSQFDFGIFLSPSLNVSLSRLNLMYFSHRKNLDEKSKSMDVFTDRLHSLLWLATKSRHEQSSRHSSMVSMAACYIGGPGFKPIEGGWKDVSSLERTTLKKYVWTWVFNLLKTFNKVEFNPECTYPLSEPSVESMHCFEVEEIICKA